VNKYIEAKMSNNEEIDEKKRSRTGFKSALTKAINDLITATVEEDMQALKSNFTISKQRFANFKTAHEDYHDTLREEKDIEDSDKYFEEMHQKYVTALREAKVILKSTEDTKPNVEPARKSSDVSGGELKMSSDVVKALHLPKAEIEPFDGNPLNFHCFFALFDESVDRVLEDDRIKLTRLLQFTRGKANEAIRSCILVGGSRGYQKAREILLERFGDNHLISEKVIASLKNGRNVRTAEDLQQLADDLENGHTTLSSMDSLSEIDTQSCIADIALRLQPFMRNRWKRHVMDIKDTKKRYPKFLEFVDFVKKQSAEATDPVYGQWGSSKPKPAENKPSKVSSYSTVTSSSGRHASRRYQCILCSEDHRLFYCQAFKHMKPTERLGLVRDKGLCENCLLANHKVDDCRKTSRCTIDGCGLKHTKFIHVPGVNDSNQSRGTLNVLNASVNTDSKFLVPVVPVIAGDKFETHAFLDNGSTTTFCTQHLVDVLQLQGHSISYNLSTISRSQESVTSKVVNFKLTSIDGRDSLMLTNVYVVQDIPVSVSPVDINAYPHLRDLPICQNVSHVSVLIGQDNCEALHPLHARRGRTGEPRAVRTLFGWSLNGPAYPGTSVSSRIVSHFISTSSELSDSSLENQVREFWKIENEGLSGEELGWSQSDKEVIQLWDDNVTMQDGHYVLPIPWKQEVSVLNNMSVAESRLKSLVTSLRKRELWEQYDVGIKKLLNANYAEPIPKDSAPERVWYLPHHAVMSKKKPGKLRIVYDCASKYKGQSLNDMCKRGPDLNNRLLYVLLRFRQHEFAFTCDIESMYYQVKVPDADRDALRFLWLDDEGNTVTYRMNAHVFGGVWCSSVATYAVRRTLLDNDDFSQDVKYAVTHAFYVDDCLMSLETGDQLMQVMTGVTDLLAKGGFRLTKFVVNKPELAEQIPESEKAEEVKGHCIGESDSKALGILWNVRNDHFYFNIDLTQQDAITRRQMLSFVTSTFDPLGLISPVLVIGKMLFQDATRLQLPWDACVPSDLLEKWRQWWDSLRTLPAVQIARCIKGISFNDAYLELHHFSDASMRAYGCCSYLRCVNKAGEIQTSLIMSKCKLGPLKAMSIPRLELQAAVLSAQIDAMLRKQLNVEIGESHFWVDSTIALQYIRSHTRRFHIFVSNRVSIIRSLTDVSRWQHIPGVDNPADLLTRGQTPHQLQDNNWFSGPRFLSRHKCDWNLPQHDIQDISDEDPEVKRDITVTVGATDTSADHGMSLLIDYYSDFYKLKRATSWLLRYLAWLKSKRTASFPPQLTVDEMKLAERCIIGHVQHQFFRKEINQLSSERSVDKSSPLSQLSPMLNSAGLLVVGGRLKNAYLPDQNRHPLIIPHKHHLAEVIIRSVHNTAHMGTEWTLAKLRTKFWVTRARPIIKQVIRHCFPCKRLFAPPCVQKMADLPPERLEPNKPPFFYIGLDCFGPFQVKYRRAEVKRYGCIYTCLLTRAIHIEKLDGLDTDSFLSGFRRFIARRGSPAKVWSDRGTNFVGGHAELLKGLKEDQLREFGLKREIEWTFNPPHSSHMGGIWERLIRTVRKVMMSILTDSRLTDDSLATLFCEVEAMVNSRPITKVSDSICDTAALTPSHLLLLREGPTSPPGNFTACDIYRRRWKHIQHLANSFWTKWLREYLPELQRRRKWLEIKRNLREGDLVLLVDENTPRSLWPLGVVVKATESSDGLVRSVQVRTKSTVLTRPVTKVVLLEGYD
jgi:hypothetical protein